MYAVYVLISCDVGSENSILAQLKKIEYVKEAIGISGQYDIIVKLESQSKDETNNIIATKIRNIENIRTTLTLPVTETQD